MKIAGLDWYPKQINGWDIFWSIPLVLAGAALLFLLVINAIWLAFAYPIASLIILLLIWAIASTIYFGYWED